MQNILGVGKRYPIPSFPKNMLFVSNSLFVNPFPKKKSGICFHPSVVQVAGRTILPMIPRVVVTEGDLELGNDVSASQLWDWKRLVQLY